MPAPAPCARMTVWSEPTGPSRMVRMWRDSDADWATIRSMAGFSELFLSNHTDDTGAGTEAVFWL